MLKPVVSEPAAKSARPFAKSVQAEAGELESDLERQRARLSVRRTGKKRKTRSGKAKDQPYANPDKREASCSGTTSRAGRGLQRIWCRCCGFEQMLPCEHLQFLLADAPYPGTSLAAMHRRSFEVKKISKAK